MINKYKNILFLALFTSFTFSCTDLEENLYDIVTAENTQLTADDLNSLIAPAYASFRGIYWNWNGLLDVYEESSDLIVTPYRVGIGWGDLYITMHKHTWGPTLGHAEGLWSSVYSAITSVNFAIYQIESLEGVEEKESVIYELRALRAIYYYLLLDNFRNVPIVTQFDVPEGFLPEQSSGQEVFSFIESELTEVMPYLSETSNSENYGKVTKWAAYMTLAKLYLNAEVYIGEAKWSDALAEVNEIIDNGGFSLESNYANLFAADNGYNSEVILAIPFDNVYAQGSYYPYKTLYGASQATFNLAGSPWGGSAGIPQFIDTYDEDDERKSISWLGGLQYDSSGEPIILEDGTQLDYTNYMTSVDAAEFNEGYRFIKYEIEMGLDGNQGNDIPFYRYTDALMIKAECLMRLGQTDEAASIVSEVRARAFGNTNPEKATLTASDLTGGSVYDYGKKENGEFITHEGGADIEYGGFLDELAWEFVGEHHRKQDLIRFGVFTTKSWLSHSPNGDYHTIFPIPQSAMETNSNLSQNTGY
ncbi:RagB/SusD family nutrient uptake outer membrane protein [Chondrinema litorale]|uniref:RagB/SusD family nutrient uptake outer membrane protein n=1 Tax=Chondrinema litorale TaxID=2994555 RepID=UPI0025433CF1|nr:RagB/SusD family nutrient uptake outer membrane protein [Chondrinema litorale]UZR98145.1 RagB/SusD family nutrient uptake outer membrane protein [Chondrinema litorale]